jgi:Mn-dependent DtxR family transcriptional regulator
MTSQNPDVPLNGLCPKYVRHSEIEDKAKVLYAEMVGMAIQEGYCYASNSFLGEIFSVSERTIKKWLNALESIGVVSRSYDQTRKKHKRRMYMPWDNLTLPLNGWIPAHVRRAPITGGAKILYAEISGMTYEEEYCFASNIHFADRFNVSKRTIQNRLTELEDVKLISIHHLNIHDSEEEEKHPRRIYLEKYHGPPTR